MSALSLAESVRVIGEGYRLQLATSVLSGVSCGLVGCFVLLRRMALIGDALSHAILPGVVIAFMLAGTGPFGLFVGAMAAGLVTALTIGFIQQHSRIKEDSSIGLAFTFFFAVGVILISALPQGTHFDLKCFLFGDPLAVQRADLWMMTVVGGLVSLAIIAFYRPLFAATFDPVMAACAGISVVAVHYLVMALLSATVVASLQAVGVIMVVAMLIAPGAAAYQLTDRLPVMLGLAALIGGIAAGGGFVLAFWRNWPTGPAMTVVAGGIFLLAMLFSPKYGAVFTRIRRWRQRQHILGEDILKSTMRRHPSPMPIPALAQHFNLSPGTMARAIARLERAGLVRRSNGHVALTPPGRAGAETILRAHRLWEQYLAERGVPPAKVHDVAEAYEHAHELAPTLDRDLGLPATDPHGRVIPRAARSTFRRSRKGSPRRHR